VSVDRHNHIWVAHRPSSIRAVDVLAGNNPPTAKCCVAAPPILEFDTDGKLLRSWGGPQIEDWFDSPHAIFVDAEDNVWILGAGNRDGQLLKFTADGKLLLRIGRKGAFVAADDPTMLARPTDIYVDTKKREVFVSDGYRNHRVIVFNADTGAFKRQWTAFGKKVDPAYFTDRDEGAPGMPAGNLDLFTTVHCVTMIGDELFVCDRVNDRIQVFTPGGKYLRQFFFNQRIAGSSGSTWDAAPVPGRPDLILVLDGTNSEIALLDKHAGKVVSSYLSKGRYAGQMIWPHQVAIDREGRLYVAEVGGAARIQRFAPNAETPR
jgi:DNA-binding beta-propeller fold protein YncE